MNSDLEEARRKRLKRQDSDTVTALMTLKESNSLQLSKPIQVVRTTRKVLNDEDGKLVIKGSWSREEDKVMLEACEKYGFFWRKVAACVKGRTAKQCRDRYRLKLDPSINHGPWTNEEDEKLLELHNDLGRSWTKISKHLPGRTENAVKSRFSSLFRARTKEWSENEEKLLQSLHSQGTSFAVIAKQHLPHRSEHAVRKRWEKLLMKQIASNIRKDMPSFDTSTTTSEGRENIPKLNPKLAAATMTTVSRSTEIPQNTERTILPKPLVDLEEQKSTQSIIGLNTRGRFVNQLGNIPGSTRFPVASTVSSTNSAFNIPVNMRSTTIDNTEVLGRAFLPTSNFTESTNGPIKAVKSRSTGRLKRYSTSTAVMMQLIGEPMNLSTNYFNFSRS